MEGTGIMTAEQAAEAARGLTFEKVWTALRFESRMVNVNNFFAAGKYF